MAADRWLRALIACASADDAGAVRRALHARGSRTRSIPVGGARLAWTAPAPAGLVGVVLTPARPERARPAARFWTPRAAAVVVVGTGGGTGLAAVDGVVLDGDAELGELARREAAAAEIRVVAGRVGGVAAPPETDEARRSLAAAGVAAVDPTLATWRAAAAAAGTPLLACRALLDPAAELEPTTSRLRGRLEALIRPGGGGTDRGPPAAARGVAARLAVAAAAGPSAGAPPAR